MSRPFRRYGPSVFCESSADPFVSLTKEIVGKAIPVHKTLLNLVIEHNKYNKQTLLMASKDDMCKWMTVQQFWIILFAAAFTEFKYMEECLWNAENRIFNFVNDKQWKHGQLEQEPT